MTNIIGSTTHCISINGWWSNRAYPTSSWSIPKQRTTSSRSNIGRERRHSCIMTYTHWCSTYCWSWCERRFYDYNFLWNRITWKSIPFLNPKCINAWCIICLINICRGIKHITNLWQHGCRSWTTLRINIYLISHGRWVNTP